MTTDTEALVRRAYHLAEGDVLDARGFIITTMFTQLGVLPDFASAVAASAPER